MSSRSAKIREPLNRERVLRAALALADRDGSASLSMRNLGQALGVEAMSLYNHVANKDEIIDGIVDLVVGEFEMPVDGGEWRACIRRGAMSAFEVLLQHPWACTFKLTRQGGSGPSQLRYADWLLGSLRRAGFSVALSHHAFHVFETYVYGSAAASVNFPFTAAELPDLAAAFLRDLPSANLPYLAEHVNHHIAVGAGGDPSFEFGLELILDGLEQRRRESG